MFKVGYRRIFLETDLAFEMKILLLNNRHFLFEEQSSKTELFINSLNQLVKLDAAKAAWFVLFFFAYIYIIYSYIEIQPGI